MDISEQIAKLDEIRGTKGAHFDLAQRVADLGFVVDADTDNNERSEIKLPGCWNPDGSDVVVGEIVGDADAEIVLAARDIPRRTPCTDEELARLSNDTPWHEHEHEAARGEWSNEDRANAARHAAHTFAEITNQIAAGDWEHDRGAVYGDLIADILHACAADGLDPQDTLTRALGHYKAEVEEGKK